jgi:hypothetical protein
LIALLGKEKGVGIYGRREIMITAAGILGMKKRKLRKRKEAVLEPFFARSLGKYFPKLVESRLRLRLESFE